MGARFQRSPPADLLEIVFDAERPVPLKGEGAATLESAGGRITGVLQWICIETAPGIVYENPPGEDSSRSWPLHYIPFREPYDTRPGEAVRVAALFFGEELLVWEASED